MLSIVIPAHNEAAFLGATLDALRAGARLLGCPFEIVVVDDDSTDGTAAIAEEGGARVVSAKLRHIAAVRNAGAAAARGDRLVFVDADTLVPPATLRAAMDALSGGAVAGGTHARLPDGEAWWARAGWAPFQWGMIVLRMPGGAFMFMTRAAFDAAGGFDERFFASEEIHLARALRKTGRFVMVHPPVTTSARKFHVLGPAGILREWLGMLIRGPRVLRSRKHLGLWYGDQRRK